MIRPLVQSQSHQSETKRKHEKRKTSVEGSDWHPRRASGLVF